MKQIWYVNPWDALPGEPGFDRSFKFIENLLENNVEVVWWQTSFAHATKKFRKKESYYYKENFELICLPTISYRSHTGLRRIISIFLFSFSFFLKSILRKKPNIVFISAPLPFVTIYIWYLKTFFKCKIVLEFRDMWPESSINHTQGFKKQIFTILSKPLLLSRKKLFLMGDSFIYLNEKFKQYVENIYPLITSRPKVVAYPSPYIDFSIISNYKCSYIKNPGEIWGVFSGTLGASHNQEIVLQALLQLKKITSLKIIFTGDGPNKTYLHKIKDDYDISNAIFTGYLNIKDYLSILQLSDFGLSFYHSHSPVAFPTKIIDYFLAELPIIMSDSAEAFKIVIENKVGIVIKEPDINNISNALEYYCNINNIAEMKKNIHKLKSNFSPQNQINKMVAITLEDT